MIKLTDPDGLPVYVNPDKVSAVIDHEVQETKLTAIFYGETSGRLVTESPEEVSRLITEYKQRQMRLQAAYNAYYDKNNYTHPSEFVAYLESEDRGE